MDYISTQEAAEKWGVSLRQVQRLLREERITGARKYGVSWMIPADAQKPDDPRKASALAGRAGAGELPHADAAEGLFPLLHLHGGDIAGAYANCNSDAERTLLDAELAFIRGDARMAYLLALPVYQNAKEMRLRLASGLTVGVCAMRFGDVAAWKGVVSAMTELHVQKDLRVERDLAVSALRVWMHGRSDYPEWLATGAYGALSPSLFPLARWLYAMLLYSKWKEVDMLAVVEPMIAECRRERSDIAEIYLRLHAATAYHDHAKKAKACAHLDAAIALAKPYGCIEPFIETRYPMMRSMDECLKAHWPEALSPIVRQTASFWESWTKVYNAVWDTPMVTLLTPREQETCSLFARGMLTNEIAKRMGISEASVRKYRATAYQKLGVTGKEELRKYMHT